jgi:hypothetical protein
MRVLILASLFVSAVAVADDPIAGTKGTVSAYESDAKTVIMSRRCEPKRLSFDYVSCGKKLREEMEGRLCQKGKGTYGWLYRVSDGRPIPQTTRCR